MDTMNPQQQLKKEKKKFDYRNDKPKIPDVLAATAGSHKQQTKLKGIRWL